MNNKIGSFLRIKLPNDYQVKDGPKLDINEPMTLDEYSDQILRPTALNMYKTWEEPLLFDFTPLTRWQRFKWVWLKDIKQRFKDIWTIVSGGDIHRNCDY